METVGVETPEDRTFPLQAYPTDFETGWCKGERQVVAEFNYGGVVASFFDAHGNYLGTESYSLDEFCSVEVLGLVEGTKFLSDVAQWGQNDSWKWAFGFLPGTIYVRQFFDVENSIGIQILPDHYLDLETADHFDDEEERQAWMRERDEWLEDGDFVWWWGKDYYMNATGEVEST